MLFNSLSFLIFFPVVTILYFLVPHRYRWGLLLTASSFFYMFFKPVYILILAFVILVDYTSALLIEKTALRSRKKVYLITSIAVNAGILIFFKYYGFANEILTGIFSTSDSEEILPALSIILPIGLSFHTFQSMSYTIEVYRGNYKAEKHPGIFALYVMFYPQLVAGPIERPQHMLPQFHEVHHTDYARISKGLRRMLWGLFKKVVIADRLSVIVDAVYNSPTAYHGMPLIIATIFFAIQIYCDFSGYCDIALGAASIMGFTMVENFKFPYFSFSFREFWLRWHISLSSWFRDYMYIPLGGNRFGLTRWILAILIVFNVSGLWHGASLTFIIWGLLHGIYLIIERIFLRNVSPENIFRPFFIFIFVSLAWIFFRSNNLEEAIYIFNNILNFKGGGFLSVPSVSFQAFIISCACIALLLLVELLQFKGLDKKIMKDHSGLIKPAYIINFLLLCGLLFFGIFEEQSFIYFQF